MTKHKLYLFEGCIDVEATIDDKPIIDSEDKVHPLLKDVIIDYINKCDSGELVDIFHTYLQIHGDYKDLGICEHCGGYNTEYTLEVEF